MATKIKEIIDRWFVYPFAILLVAISFLSLFRQQDDFLSLQKEATLNPHNFPLYLQMAQELLENNQFKKAGNVLSIIGSDSGSVQLKSLWLKKHLSDPHDVSKLITDWEQIVSDKPTYRDGYLQLAYLNMRIKQDKEAKEFLNKALNIDPNYPPSLEMEALLNLH